MPSVWANHNPVFNYFLTFLMAFEIFHWHCARTKREWLFSSGVSLSLPHTAPRSPCVHAELPGSLLVSLVAAPWASTTLPSSLDSCVSLDVWWGNCIVLQIRLGSLWLFHPPYAFYSVSGSVKTLLIFLLDLLWICRLIWELTVWKAYSSHLWIWTVSLFYLGFLMSLNKVS